MHFSSGINRPPYEARDGFLQVTSGCSHGSCEFCTFYKDAPFKVSPMEEVEADIKELSRYGRYERIFLQGADPFILPSDKLLKIAELIHRYIPSVKTIGGYARIDNVDNKSVDDLRRLAEAGFSDFYFGNESGDDHILDIMHKGYHSDKVVRACQKMDAAGMSYILNFLGGLGGHGYGLDHARKSADVINQTHPTMVYASELTLFPDTPLMAAKRNGTFQEATEEERLEEMKELIRCLTVPTIFIAEHTTIPIPVRGKLPEDKERMMDQLDREIEMARAGKMDHFRESVKGL